MKMTDDDFRDLNDAILFTLDLTGNHVSDVDRTAYAWQLFHAASDYNRINVNALYEKYNDAHIETALRQIFPNIKRNR